MAGDSLGGQMAASYTVNITGIERTRNEVRKLDGAIRAVRQGSYSPHANMTVATSLGGSDIFVTKLDAMEGRIQTAVEKAMIAGMDLGKETQIETLQAAVTAYGSKRMARGRGHGPGRDDSGEMIKAIKRSVEVFKSAGMTVFTGWHGWGLDEDGKRIKYYGYQEKGTGLGNRIKKARRETIKTLTRAHRGQDGGNWNTGVPAANSLGAAIVIVREQLKRELGKLKK